MIYFDNIFIIFIDNKLIIKSKSTRKISNFEEKILNP